MDDYASIMKALRAADAAGDTEAAARLAQMAKAKRSSVPGNAPATVTPPQDSATPRLPNDPAMPGGFDPIQAAMAAAPTPQALPAADSYAPPMAFGPMGGMDDTWAQQEAARRGALEQAMAPAAESSFTPTEPTYTPTGEAIVSELGNVPERIQRGFLGNTLQAAEGAIKSALDRIGRAKGVPKQLAEIQRRKTELSTVQQSDPYAAAEEFAQLDEMEKRLTRAVDSGIPGMVIDSARSSMESAQRDRFAAQTEIDALEAAMTPVQPAPGLPEALTSGIASFGDMAPGLAATLATRNPIPMLAYLGLYSRGSTYADKRAEGYDSGKATTAANLYALAESVPEMLPLGVILKEGIGPITKIAGAAGTEAISEGITSTLQQLIDIGVLDESMTWGQAIEETKKAMMAGGVMGGFMGGGGVLADSMRDTIAKRRATKGTPADPTAYPAITQQPAPPSPAPLTLTPEQLVPPDPLAAAIAPAPEAAPPVVPQAPDPLQAAMAPAAPPTEPATSQDPAPTSITLEQASAQPDQYEIIEESEGVGAEWQATGRQIARDKVTGAMIPITKPMAGAAGGAAPQPQAGVEPTDTESEPAGNEPEAAPPAADQTSEVEAPASSAPARPNQPDNIEFIDAAGVQRIGTEPGVMQYKAGGDEQGVTDRLKGVTEWRPERAGMSIVYEYEDGRRVIADGHQRLGLAKRLASEGKPIQMPVMILRQRDGVTPQEARTTAALKNIAEGSGTAVDAAKVLRDTDRSPEQLGLPPSSALVRDAIGMRNLSPEAFGMVVNGISSERDGGIVGRIVQDKAAQKGILALLNRLKPSNAFQAESIVRQAAADTVTETQDSLFGPEMDTQNLYLERAKILDAATKRVRDDLKTFKTLVDQAETVSGAGNVLNATENERRLAADTAVRDYLGKEANTKGAISDALTAAARAFKSGAKPSQVVADFLAAVQRELGSRGAERPSGDQGGQRPGQQGQTESVEPEGIDGDAADGDLFGATPQTGKSPEQIKAEAEANVKAQQSMIRKPGGNSGDAGPLFNLQPDLLDTPSKPDQGARGDEELRAKVSELQKRRSAFLYRWRRPSDARFNDSRSSDDIAEGSPDFVQLLNDLAAAGSQAAREDVATAWVLAMGKRTGFEHLVVLDSEGAPVSVVVGQKSTVSPEAAIWRAGDAGEVAFTVHNHPSSSGYSGPDLALVSMWPGHRMRIVGHDGKAMTVKAKPAMQAAPEADGDRELTFAKLNEVLEDVRVYTDRAVNRHLLDKGEASGDGEARFRTATRPFLSLVLHDLGFVTLTDRANWLKVFEEQGFNYGDFYGQVSGKVTDRLGRAGFVIPEGGDQGGDRPAAGGSAAAPSGTDRSDQEPAGNAGQGRPVRPSTGNDALDGALDDLFGSEDDVPGTGTSVEPDRGGGAPADGMGGTDVPTPGGRPRTGTGKRGGASGKGAAKRPGRRGVPDGAADAVGGAGNPKLAGAGGVKPGRVPAGKRGPGAAGGAGGLSPDAAGSGSAAGPASGGTGVSPRTPEQQVADIKKLFEERLAAFLRDPQLAFREDASGLDPRKKEALESIFNEGMQGLDPAKMSDRDLFKAIITPLIKAGLTRELVVKLQPYLETYLADVRAGRINPRPAPKAEPAPDDRAAMQAKADKIKPVAADEANIRATLPLLLPEQQDDVLKVERRFAKPDGHGMMITNGTGTGKTFSGGGVVKRFVQMGKGNVLILAPSEAVIAGWKGALAQLGVPVHQLADTKDAGQGVTITTYANLNGNDAIASRKFDLIVPDEAQNLSSNAQGDPTGALRAVRALAGRPGDLRGRSRMIHAADWDKFKAMKDGAEKTTVYTRLKAREDAEVAKWLQEPRGKVLFLSATPFAYDQNIDYAEGFLFDYPEDGKVGNSRQSGRSIFFTQNFGYRIRYHKLTRPEAAVDSAVFEREFHEKLKRDGVLTGRSLQIDVDYDRKFVVTADAIGTKIDAILDAIWQNSSNPDKALADGYQKISREVRRKFSYLKRMQLLEAIKARAAVPDIKAHLALGRKVVVFHDYNVGGGFNPFADLGMYSVPQAAGPSLNVDATDDANFQKAWAHLLAQHPDILKLDFSPYGAPNATLQAAFGKRARIFSGVVPQKQRLAGLTEFNKDGSGVDVLVVQAEAGGAGISMHDVTGKHQRVLINLGMPTKPTTTLQEEGRILRVGTRTNAAFRYYTIGTAWEKTAFAQRIAERSGAVENLALGNQARAITQAFIDAYMDAEPLAPSAEDGKGGKGKDRAAALATPYDIAKTHYFGRAKISGKRDQRDGIDFYPTPEPLGFIMASRWAAIRPNERVLEPSAGDGAIARYVPDYADLTMVEPSSDLAATAQLRAPGARIVGSTFENLHISNKYHAIVMNPPFGSGGKTAMEHLSKAVMRHLRPGGRVVALIPTGPSADKRFDAWWEGDEAKDLDLRADVTLPAVAFERAGTSVMARVVVIDKLHKGETADGQTARINLSGAQDIKIFFDRLEQYDVPARRAPKMDAVEEIEAEGQDATTPPAAPVQRPPISDKPGDFKLGQTKHGKTGEPLFVATAGDRVARESYLAMLDVAKSHGGWYSSFRGNGAIPGFQFKTEAARQAFLDDMAKPQQGMSEDPGTFISQQAFYSPLLRAIEGAKQTKATPKDWRAILPKLPGAKKAELDWLGADEWLATQETQGVRMIDRASLADFIREQQIGVQIDALGDIERLPQEPINFAPVWRDPDEDAAEALIDQDDDWDEPDYRISEGEAVYPDDWDDEAEYYMDEAREELEREAEEDWDEDEMEGPFDPSFVADDAVLELAKRMAEERFEPREYSVTLYDRNGKWPEYDGYWDNDSRDYYFPDLSDDQMDDDDAIRAAKRKWEEGRQKAIEAKLAEMLAQGLEASGKTREEFDEEVAQEEADYQRRLEQFRIDNAAAIATNEGRGFVGASRWRTYTEADGENYREILIRVPKLHQIGMNAARTVTEPSPANSDQQMTYTKPGKKPFVQSSHFENENIVVHARVKDRVDADGKRVLFIEEIQSDLASKWREVREDTPEVAAKRAELTEENDRLMREEANARFPLMQMMDRNNHPLVHQHYTVVREQLRHIINLALGRVEADENSPNRKFAEIVKSDQDLMSSARTYIAAVDRRAQVLSDLLALGTERKADPTLPQSPWADPEQYTLMVKSLLREAAVKGYDKLSWTPGWMQARRWNKAGQSVVEAVEWETGSEGGKRITLQMMGGRGIKSIRTDAQGVILSVDTDMGAEGVGQPLTRLLGGDVAKQIMAEEGGKVSGQKITFGSSGYAIAYDGHIRRAVEKLVKPYGARPAEDRSLPDFKGSRKQLTDYLKTLSAAEVIRRATEVQALPPAGLDYARRELRNGTGEDWIISNMTSSIEDGKLREMAPEIDTTDAVWSVEITDDLRKGAGQAQPLFQRVPPNVVRESRAAIEEINRQMPALRRELDRLNLKRVNLYRDTKAWYQGMFILHTDGALEIAIGASLDPMKTLHHEAIHALRTMNLFTPEEWQALELAAAKGWIKKHQIDTRYADLSPEQQIEEAIAEEFSEALAARKSPQGSLLVHAFNKIARFLRAIRNVFNGAGFQTAEDVFGRVLSGEIGARAYHQARSKDAMRAQSAPVATLSGNELGVQENVKDLGRAAENWYAENLLGQSVINAATGMAIEFNRRGAKKVGGRKGDTIYRIVPALREILASGQLVDTMPDRLGRPEVRAVHKIGAAVNLAGEIKHVIATVREMADGTYHYDLSLDREAGGFASPTVQDDSRTSALDGGLADLNLQDSQPGFKEEPTRFQRPRAIRPLGPQARAHRATAMGGAVFVPDRRVWEELRRAGLPIWQRLANSRGAARDAIDRARVLIQDRFLPVRRAQQAIEEASGVRLPDAQNAYAAETTYSGKVGRHLFEIDEQFTKPVIDLISDTKGALSVDDVGAWLYARHAIERNARIAQINPQMPDGGSGMTNAEARSILAQAAAGPHAHRLQTIGDLVDKLRERSLALRVDAGLLTHEDADMWRRMYRHYVPLKGWAETDHADATLDVTGIGRRMNVQGPESRRALGRESEAFNPLQAVITQAQEVAIRAEKNRVGQALHDLAKDNPSKALWEVKEVEQKRYYNRTTGMVETRIVNPAQMILQPNEMSVKVGGKEVRIVLHDPRIARAVSGIGADQMGTFIRFIAPLSRWYSMARTMLNPVFVITNAVRDFVTAQINVLGLDTPAKLRIAKAMARDWPKAFAGALRGGGGKADTEWSMHFRDFQRAGAQVSFWNIENPEEGKADLERRLRLKRGPAALRAFKRLVVPSMRDNILLHGIERVNLAVDNAIRLAAFVEAKRSGMSEQDAAFLSKELTVNFNRRGEYGPTLNVIYPFFNAATQGSVRLLQALKNRKILVGMTIGGIGLGLILDLVNAALSDEDDDGELLYDKIPDYRNRRSLHFVGGSGGSDAWAVPMAYGYNIFPYAGQQLGKVIRGVKDPDRALADVGAAFLQSWVPTDSLVPGLVEPVMEIAENKNYFGNTIYPEDFYGHNSSLPDAAKYYPSATGASVWIAKTLNELTGGNAVTSGLVDLSPEVMDHLSAFVVGSAGAFYGRTFDTLGKALSGNYADIETKDVPFLSIVRSEVSPWIDKDRYRTFGAEVRDAKYDLDNWPASSGPAPADLVATAALYERLLQAEREIDGKGEFRQFDKNGNANRNFLRLPRDERSVIMEFNREFLKVAGKRAE